MKKISRRLGPGRSEFQKAEHERFLEKECDFFTACGIKCACGESRNGWITQYHINMDGTVTMIGERDGRKEAIRNWNRRAPILTPVQISLLEISREPRKFEEGLK